MSDEFQNWRDALAGKETALHADVPHPGFYKVRPGKGQPWQPVAIWRTVSGDLVCRVADMMRDPMDVWTWAAKNPVTKEAAQQAFKTGTWPGDVIDADPVADNASIIDKINAAATAAEAFLQTPITNDAASDQAANHRAKLLELAKSADVERESKVRPHLDAQRQINAAYKPALDLAEQVAAHLRRLAGQYMAAKEDALRKAAAEAAARENARIAAEHAAAAKEAAAKGQNEPVPEPVYVAPAPVKVSAGGQTGRKTGLKTKVSFEIEDYAAVLAHVKDHDDVVAAVQKVAFAQMRSGVAVPGVKRIEERVAI